MSWKKSLQTTGQHWEALIEYVDERLAFLTQVCLDESQSDIEIRKAQAAISELNTIKRLPQTLRAEAQFLAQTVTARQGY